jgi:hypothetical protein
MKTSYTLTLPWWPDGEQPDKDFVQITNEKNQKDLDEMSEKKLQPSSLKQVGFKNFVNFMDKKVEQMFSEAIDPVLKKLQQLQDDTKQRVIDLEMDLEAADPGQVTSTTKECGTSFANSLKWVMRAS